MKMKVEIDDVHASMLKELCKKYRLKDKDLVEEYIRDNYNNVFKRRR